MTTDSDERLRATEPDEARAARIRARREAAARARRRRRRLAIGLVVLVAAGVVAALALRPEGGETSVAEACAEESESCLHALSDVAAAQGPLAAGAVFYARNDLTSSTTYIGADGRPTARPAGAAYAVSRTVPEELWLAPDGSGRLAYGDERPPEPAGPADERAWRAAGSPDLEDLVGSPQRLEEQEFGAGELESALLVNSGPLSALPREPGELATFLRERGADVTTLLRYPLTPPDLRAALLDVLAAVPDARALGTLRDGADRDAVAIALPQDKNILAFDPRTARLLAEGSSDGDGGVRWESTYDVATAAVEAVGNRP